MKTCSALRADVESVARAESISAVTVPVRALHVIEPNGGCTTQLSVFCPNESVSITLDRCQACPMLRDKAALGGVRALRCVREPTPHGDERAARSTRVSTPVGELMTSTMTCVRGDVSLARLPAIVGKAPGASDLLAIVDDRGRYLGAFIPGRDPRSVWTTSVPALVTRPSATASDVARSLLPVLESTSVLDAARLLASTRMRRLPVVSAQRTVVGMIDDLALLRAMTARARRPPT